MVLNGAAITKRRAAVDSKHFILTRRPEVQAEEFLGEGKMIGETSSPSNGCV